MIIKLISVQVDFMGTCPLELSLAKSQKKRTSMSKVTELHESAESGPILT